MTSDRCLRASGDTKYRFFKYLDAILWDLLYVRCSKSVGILYKRAYRGRGDYVYRLLKH